MSNVNMEELLKKITEIGILKKCHENSSEVALELRDFEEQLGIKIPDDFKEFILRYGNMYLKDDYYYKPLEKNPWTPEDEFQTVDLFYGFSGDSHDLRTVSKDYSDRIPDEYITIADLPGGNQLCLCVKGENYGKLYFWDHELRDPNGKEMFLCSNSFSDLIMNITSYSRKKVDLSKVKVWLHEDLLKD